MRAATETRPQNHLSENLYVFPMYAKSTLTTEQLRETLLATSGWILANGERWEIKSKRIGPGVYRVWLERSEAS